MDNDNWGHKIKKLRAQRELTQDEVAQRSGLSKAYISRIENGFVPNPSKDTFMRLAKGFGLTESEFNRYIYGKETKVLESPDVILEQLRLATPVMIPVYDEFPVRAGGVNEPMDYVYVDRRKAAGKNIEAYKVKGDCLAPKIDSGDVIIVDRTGEINVGDIAVCIFDGELHLGYIRKVDGELWLENGHGMKKLSDCQAAAPIIGRVTTFK